MTAKHFPPIQYLHECFDYDPCTGLFLWRKRPSEHFERERYHRAWNARFAGAPAFTQLTRNGYLVGRVSFDDKQVRMLAHRVAWALMTGAHPSAQIDHRNRDKADNRWSNLREAVNAENGWNTRGRDKVLPRGVSRNGKNFAAGIWNYGKYTYIGTFQSPEDAGAAWRKAAVASRGEFARVD